MLGIARNDSCIENDDDIDILIDIKHKDQLNTIFKNKGFKFLYDKKTFYKIEIESTKPTIDFYFCTTIENGDFYDHWENVTWTNTKPFIQKKWNDVVLFLPNNYEAKLVGRYGTDWKIPQHSKGIFPRKTKL